MGAVTTAAPEQPHRRIDQRQRGAHDQPIARALDADRAFVAERAQDDRRAIRRLQRAAPPRWARPRSCRGVQRAMTRPVASVVSNSAFGIASDSSPSRWRAATGAAACARSSADVVAQRGRARRQLLHLLQEQPARDLQAALGLELDPLLDAGEDQQRPRRPTPR